MRRTVSPRPLLQSSAFSTLATGFVGQGLLFVTSVLSARLLGPEDRGDLALALLGASALSTFGRLGLPSGVTYQLARASDAPTAARIRGAALVIALVLGVGSLAIYGLGLLIVEHRFEPDVRLALWIAGLAVAPSLAMALPVAVVHAMPGLILYNTVRTLPLLFYTVILVVLAFTGTATLTSVTSAWAVGVVLAAGIAFALVIRQPLTFASVGADIRMIVRYGFVAYPGTLGASDAQRIIEQAVIAAALSTTELGLWSVAAGVRLLVGLLARDIRYAAFPDIARVVSSGGAARKARRYLYFTIGTGGSVALVLIVGAEGILRIIYGEEFVEAADALRILVMATCLVAIRQSIGDSLRAMGRPIPGTLSELASLLTVLVLLVPMAHRFGLVGAAVAVLAASAIALGAMVAPARTLWRAGAD